MAMHAARSGPEAPDETPDQRGYRARVREWYDSNATRKSVDEPWEIPTYLDESQAHHHFDVSREWQRRLFDAGLTGIAWPKEYGGQGGESWMARIAADVARDYEEHPGFLGATIAMLGPTLMRHGTEQQKTDLIPRLLSGEMAFCQLFSEPGAGSDLASLATRAERDGDEFVINGQKVWNSAAQFCDWGFILVRTDPDLPKHAGITFLLIDMSSPGVEVRPLVQINRSAHFNEVFLSDVRVPVGNVVGEINGGWKPARTVMTNESAFIGGGRGLTTPKLIELARLHGRLDDPVVRQGIADFHSRERISKMMAAAIQQSVRLGRRPSMDPSLLKLMAAESKVRSGNLAMAIAGAAATTGDDPAVDWAQYELMARYSVSIGGGTNEVQRNNIGERSLGLPREPRPDKDTPWRELPR